MDIRKVKKLIELLEESGIDEIEIKEGEESVRISRNKNTQPASYGPPVVPSVSPVHPVAPVEPAEIDPTSPANQNRQGHVVRAPTMGTFYRGSSPETPFVEVGQQVKVGDALFVVEAMNKLNEVEADRTGTVETIMVEDGQSVESDQPIIIIS